MSIHINSDNTFNNFKEYKVSTRLQSKLQKIKSETEIEPNLMCRLGFCFSLNMKDDKGMSVEKAQDNSKQIIRKEVLFGDNVNVYASLFEFWCIKHSDIVDKISKKDLIEAHITRGLSELIYLIFKGEGGKKIDFTKLRECLSLSK